jgi:hypothetical protein
VDQAVPDRRWSMKIRTGFVSNSSSTCFICDVSVSEDEQFCSSCLLKMVLAPDFLRWLSKKHNVPIDESFITNILQEYNKARGGGWET